MPVALLKIVVEVRLIDWVMVLTVASLLSKVVPLPQAK